MIREKAIFIIPGYNHLPTGSAYRKIATMLQNEGYQPILVKIPWTKTTISQNTDYFLKKYKKINAKKKYILGFSLGAMIAFVASTKVTAYGLILCSLSPFFNEDLLKINTKRISPIQLRRHQDFLTLHCSTLSKKIKAKQILMIYGREEEKSLIKRVKETYRQLSSKNKYLIPVDQTEHNIGDKRYLYKIRQLAKTLN